MRRVWPALILAAIAAPLIWWVWPREALSARFAHDDCSRIALRDAETGAAVTGVEDIAVLPDGLLLLSAHDRLDPGEPDGGLYLLAPDLLARGGTASVRSILPADTVSGGLRPHGIAIHPTEPVVAFINRGRGQPVRLTLARYDLTARRLSFIAEGAPHPLSCAANDLVFEDQSVLITLDRGHCISDLREVLGVDHLGSVIRVPLEPGGNGEVTPIATALAFPNGIAIDPVAGGVIIAETRAGTLRSPQADARVVPGGPDNLTLDGPDLVAALHPSLIRLGLYRYDWTDSAPSRIVSVGPERVEILFDDPDGALFSGATVGQMVGDRLFAGSVRDAGLLLCERS